MRHTIFIILLSLFCPPLKAQQLQGFYTGQLKLSGQGIKMSVQMDIMEEAGAITAVIRFRAVEDNQVSGCDNWLQGTGNATKFNLHNMVTLKETNIAPWVCNDFVRVEMSLKKGSTPQSPEYNGVLLNREGGVFAKITLAKVDTANSFSVADESAEAAYRIGEKQIAMAASDSAQISLMLANRGVQLLDSLELDAQNANLLVEAPMADRFHRLTLLINDNVILFNSPIAQKGVNIKLNELVEGDIDITLVCYHVLVEVNFPVKLTLTYNGNEKAWEVPVSTYKNRAIRLKVNPKKLP